MSEQPDLFARDGYIDLPDGRFHYLTWGTDHTETPPILLLQGITSSALSWVRVGPALAKRYRVYALDMRGHGDSIKPPPGSYSLSHTAGDVAAFIEALDMERPILIGHSWGGATVLFLATGAGSDKLAPGFTKLILEDPAINFRPDRSVQYTKDIGRPSDELRPEIYASNPGWIEADVEGKLDAMRKVSRDAVESVFRDTTPLGNLLPQLARLPAPTLLMRADPTCSTTLEGSSWEEAKSYLPAHSQAVQIDHADHNIHRSQFKAFMQAVDDFLKS